MPKFIVNVDMDSPREEGEHIEKKFENGIEACDEHEAEEKVREFIDEQMYGGPYYSISEADDDE
jgi:regulatory protein YycI of two-component signal transduction system YycFG|tara:strand:+ start:170 stop:361 length:192 start_codon:yes stop_codon:yes gene_type:complete